MWVRENQQDATNSIFLIKFLSRHISGIIMHIVRRIRPCLLHAVFCTVCVGHGWLWSWGSALIHIHADPQPTQPGRTPHTVGHGLILLMICIMMPETCWDRSLKINIGFVASCWFLSLRLIFTMPGHKILKQKSTFSTIYQ